MTEETPKWTILRVALKSVLAKFELDLNHVGTTQRIDYTDFEKIFYHLLIIIDPNDCRRKLWSLYPARDLDGRSRFIELTTQLINDRQIGATKISSGQLRVCGGEPFRRLLCSLIKKAAQVEIQSIERKLSNVTTQTPDVSLTELEDSIVLLKSQILNKSNDLEHGLNELVRLENLLEMKNGIKNLLDQLETSNGRVKVAVEKIKSLEIYPDFVKGSTILETSKRMSNFVNEIRECLLVKPDTAKSKIENQLAEYDNGNERLISTLEDEIAKIDAALLEKEEMRERYNFFSNLIPAIEFAPIISKDQQQITVDKQG